MLAEQKLNIIGLLSFLNLHFLLFAAIVIIRPGRQKPSYATVYAFIVLKPFILKFHHVVLYTKRLCSVLKISVVYNLLIYICIYRMFQGESTVHRENVSYIKLRGYVKSTCIRS